VSKTVIEILQQAMPLNQAKISLEIKKFLLAENRIYRYFIYKVTSKNTVTFYFSNTVNHIEKNSD